MNRYIIIYQGGDKPSSPEEGKNHFAEYQAWLAAMGDAVVVAMQPHKDSQIVKPDGSNSQGSSADISGHTVIQAESMDKALEYAKQCPFLAINGTLEVAELVDM